MGAGAEGGAELVTTYVQKDIASDIDLGGVFNLEISEGIGVDGSVVVTTRPVGGAVLGHFISVAGVPNSDDWENGGTWTVEIEVDVGNMDMTLAIAVARFTLGPPASIPQTGVFTAFQNLQMSRTFNPVAPVWSLDPDDCEFRLGLTLAFASVLLLQSVTIGLGTIANEVTADITEDICTETVASEPIAAAFGPAVVIVPGRVIGY